MRQRHREQWRVYRSRLCISQIAHAHGVGRRFQRLLLRRNCKAGTRSQRGKVLGQCLGNLCNQCQAHRCPCRRMIGNRLDCDNAPPQTLHGWSWCSFRCGPVIGSGVVYGGLPVFPRLAPADAVVGPADHVRALSGRAQVRLLHAETCAWRSDQPSRIPSQAFRRGFVSLAPPCERPSCHP